MTLQNQKSDKMIEVLNDLVKIHNDRIAAYLYALNHARNISPALCKTFENIVIDGMVYTVQLGQKIKEGSTPPLKQVTTFGKVYRSWMAEKVTFPGSTQSAIISSCLCNEKTAIRAYNTALHLNLLMRNDVRQLIEKQQSALKEVIDIIGTHQEPQLINDSKTTYFTKLNLAPNVFYGK